MFVFLIGGTLITRGTKNDKAAKTPAMNESAAVVSEAAEDPDAGLQKIEREKCIELCAIGEGDHICNVDPHKMPVSDYQPTGDYLWCRGKHFSRL